MLALIGTTQCGICQADQLVIHLYVDPVYGDDGAVNSFFNPDGAPPECTGQTIVGPHSVRQSGAGTAPLLHASHPFKTITAAIAYVNRLSGGGPPLPHTDPTTGLTWSYAILHLLPGWYGPAPGRNNKSLDASTGTHKASRLVPNGDTFPLHIPPRVSLAGTSALNTIIDLGQVGTAIEFGKVVNGIPLNGEGTFVDKVTFFACGGFENVPGSLLRESDPRKCAAIFFDEDVSCSATISNCVFLKNTFGMLVSGAPVPRGPIQTATYHDGITVVNCTFAWNIYGLWNGQLGNVNSVGVNKLNLINNIFDGCETIDPTSTWPCHFNSAPNFNGAWTRFLLLQPASANPSGIQTAFEGVSREDLRVLVNGVPMDSNAYELGINTISGAPEPNYNRRPLPGAFLPGLPLTSPRTSPTSFGPDPTRNLASYTGWQLPAPLPRGVLYITDLICRGRVNQALPTGAAFSPFTPNNTQIAFDGSMHDFRLSPIAVPASITQIDPNTFLPNGAALNPLVDAGFSGPFPVTMENGQVVAKPPGFLALNQQSQPAWQHHCWESDSEGYGNNRIYDHPAYPNTPQGSAGHTGVDIGADELGELVVAGYRFGSTTFLALPTNHADLPANVSISNRNLWYLGPPDSLRGAGTPANTISQPDFRTIQGLAGFDMSTYPATFGTSIEPTWHSAETLPTQTPNSTLRPFYQVRNQNQALGRFQLPPAVPSPVSPPDFFQAIANLGQSYRATAADITPALLPDIHPWWMEIVPQTFFRNAFTLSPTFQLWQNGATCLGGNYLLSNAGLDLHNIALYAIPSTQDIHPPGAGVGFALPTGSYVWLDGTASPLPISPPLPPTVASFEHWSPSPLVLAGFDAWCRGGTGPLITGAHTVTLPSTNSGLPETAALRFTLEWKDADAPWLNPPGSRRKNIQSFLVVTGQ